MGRLTERDKDGFALQKPFTHMGEVVDRLAAYEDAEEQKLLVRLPCKIGTPVWRVNFDKRKRLIQQEAFCAASIDMWGKTVFKSREEAEAALAKDG